MDFYLFGSLKINTLQLRFRIDFNADVFAVINVEDGDLQRKIELATIAIKLNILQLVSRRLQTCSLYCNILCYFMLECLMEFKCKHCKLLLLARQWPNIVSRQYLHR